MAAGLGTGGVFGLVCESGIQITITVAEYRSTDRLGWRTTAQTVIMGGIIGASVAGLDKAKGWR